MASQRLKKPHKIFISFSHKDEELRAQLVNHLTSLTKNGIIVCWDDRRMSPGAEWRGQIDDNLETASVILLLVSSDFLTSDYCRYEMARARELHNAKKARVIPIILRPVVYQDE